MGGASLVHEDFNLRMLTHQRTGRSRVIEMDMRQQNRPDVSHGGTVRASDPRRVGHTRRGPGINQGHPAGAPQHGSGNDTGVSLKQKIGERDAAGYSVHSVLNPSESPALCPGYLTPTRSTLTWTRQPHRLKAGRRTCVMYD